MERPTEPLPLTSKAVLQQAQAEGWHCAWPRTTRATGASINRGGQLPRARKQSARLGSYATAEEAALCVARSPDGQTAAGKAAEIASSLI